jgi:hypothetical protein
LLAGFAVMLTALEAPIMPPPKAKSPALWWGDFEGE